MARLMHSRDYLKATLFALLILALDLAIAFVAVWFYSLVIDPGHPAAYYTAAAPGIATLSTRIAGPALFLLFVWRLSLRHPERNPWAFALATFLAYYLIDGAVVAYQGFFTGVVFVTMLLKLAGALGGAGLARREFARRGLA